MENISITENFTHSNMNEFTLNRNDNDFFKVVSTVANDNKNQLNISNKMCMKLMKSNKFQLNSIDITSEVYS